MKTKEKTDSNQRRKSHRIVTNEMMIPKRGKDEESGTNCRGKRFVDKRFKEPKFPFWKRMFDLFCILLTLPLWLPLMMLIAIGIFLVSPGPIFFRQERVGLGGKPFSCWKFRSMRVNAETMVHEAYLRHLMSADCPMTKLDVSGDPRLIRFGKLFRALGLDELPQLFNIICGEMSIVGPRPCTPSECEHYTEDQQERFTAPPGLTGYWQVHGKNKTTFKEMIAMDIYYANHMSIWMDSLIVLRTFPAIVHQLVDQQIAKFSNNQETGSFQKQVS